MKATDPDRIRRSVRPALALAILLTVAAGCLLSTMDAFAKHLSGRYEVLQVVWARYTFHTVIVLIVLAAQNGFGFLRPRRPRLQAMRAGALLGVTVCMYTALAWVPLADATAVMFFAPVLVTLLSGVYLGEHVGPRRVAAVVVGFCGMLLVVRPGFAGTSAYMLLPVGAACFLALYLLLTRYLNSVDRHDATLFYTTGLGTVVLSLMVPFVWQTPDPAGLASMAAMGGLGAAGHLCLVTAFRFAPASVLSPFLYAQLIWAGVISVLHFGDALTAPMLLGTAVLVASGLYIWRRENAVGSVKHE